MDEAAPPARRLWVYVACLVSAALLYPITLLSIRDMMLVPSNVGSSVLLGVSEFLLWLVLIAFVYAASARAPSTPLIHAVRAWIALGGALASLYAVSGPDNAIWVWTTPWLMPPLAVLFGLWSTWRPNAPAKARHLFAIGFAAIALPLIAAPFVQSAIEYPEAARYAREEQRERECQDFDNNSGYEARYRALSARSRFEDFLSYTCPGNRRREGALAIARTVPTRHRDAVRVVDESAYALPPQELWEFDIDVTPELCRSYRQRLLRDLERWEPDRLPLGFPLQYRNIEWLSRRGCDLSREMRRMIAAGRAQLPPEHEFAARLEALLRPEARPSDESSAPR